jgi:FkbM family methyltransferase
MKIINDFYDYLSCSWHCRKTAKISITILNELGIIPRTIIDVGASQNQVTSYWKKEWPYARLISFEPNPECQPSGDIIRMALSDKNGMEKFICEKGFSRLGLEGQIVVPIRRFDSLKLDFEVPAIIKVDCEDGTYAVLKGMGEYLRSFSAIHVEMLNHLHFDFVNKQSEIHALMWGHGFKHHKTVDAISWPNSIACTDVLFWQ